MHSALARHDALLRAAVESSNGRVVKTTGDGLHAVFNSGLDGLQASINAQQSLRQETWGETGPLEVRMGLHIGEANRGAAIITARPSTAPPASCRPLMAARSFCRPTWPIW